MRTLLSLKQLYHMPFGHIAVFRDFAILLFRNTA